MSDLDRAAPRALLEVRHLTVEFNNAAGRIRAVNDVSFSLGGGRTLAILGESGSGKTMLLRALLGIQPASARVSGHVWMRGTDLLQLPEHERERIRGAWISMVFQNPMTALDPVFTVERQLVETIRRHTDLSAEDARGRAHELLKLVQIPSPEQRLRAYPFEMSGGMRQRVVIAIALACRPSLLLADEPTTALDVTVQARVLELLRNLQQQLGMSVIFVTHDVAVAMDIADEVLVMYAGRIVEHGPVGAVLRQAAHPYTRGLLEATVRPGQRERPNAIPGSPPALGQLPPGCAFAPRCRLQEARCWERVPDLYPVSSEHEARCVLVADETAAASSRRMSMNHDEGV